MFKILLLIVFCFTLTVSDIPEQLRTCLKEKCADQYSKCQKKSGCQAKLEKCADKCGLTVNQTCWALCIGLPGTVANVALCAVNQGCIADRSKADVIGLNLMGAIDQFYNKQ